MDVDVDHTLSSCHDAVMQNIKFLQGECQIVKVNNNEKCSKAICVIIFSPMTLRRRYYKIDDQEV